MIFEAILAAVSGGATGLFGSAINDVTSHFSDKQKYKFELSKSELDIKMLKAETEASIRVAETEQETRKIEANAKMEEAELTGFLEAQKSDTDILVAVAGAKESSILLNIAAFTRTMVRPLLTLYLCVLSTMMYMDARNSLEGLDLQEGLAQTLKVYSDTTNNVLYLTSASVLFWFGQRKRKQKI